MIKGIFVLIMFALMLGNVDGGIADGILCDLVELEGSVFEKKRSDTLYQSILQIDGLSIHDLCIDHTGNLFLSGRGKEGRSLLVGISSTGSYLWTDELETESNPRKIAIDSEGRLIVAKYSENAEGKFTHLERWENLENGVVKKNISKKTGQPLGLWCVQTGIVLYSYEEKGNHRLEMMDDNGNPIWIRSYDEHTLYIKEVLSDKNGYMLIGYTMDGYEEVPIGFVEQISREGKLISKKTFNRGTELCVAVENKEGEIAVIGSKEDENSHKERAYIAHISELDVEWEKIIKSPRIYCFDDIVLQGKKYICSGIVNRNTNRVQLIVIDRDGNIVESYDIETAIEHLSSSRLFLDTYDNIKLIIGGYDNDKQCSVVNVFQFYPD